MGNAASAEVQDVGAPAGFSELPSALVIVGPSGVGKGTLIDKLREGSDKYGFSCSHTTRKPREGEQDGVHYHFTTKDEFERGIAEGKFLEYAYVHSNIYGTSIKAVQDVGAQGKCCILDIDVQGARQVRASGLRAIFVFISPPSVEELERRLRGRGTETEEQITTRLKNAREELASLEEAGLYDYLLVNNDLESCLKELQIAAGRALAGEVGGPPVPESARTASTSRNEPVSATASLRGWLGDTGSPDAGSLNLPTPAVASGLRRWRGSVVLVTGATGDVGRAITLALAGAGLRVVAVARRKRELEALQDAVSNAGMSLTDFLPIVCDVTKEAEVVALPRIVVKRWPGSGIDLLVNAAAAGRNQSQAQAQAQGGAVGIESGSGTGTGTLMGGSTPAWVESVSTNILGTALVTREVVQDMRRRGEWGHVVNVTCAAGASGSGGMQTITSGAVKAMADGLRHEAAAAGVGLRVSCVATGTVQPGAVESGPGGLGAIDVANAVVWCIGAPSYADVNEVIVRALPAGVPPPSL